MGCSEMVRLQPHDKYLVVVPAVVLGTMFTRARHFHFVAGTIVFKRRE